MNISKEIANHLKSYLDGAIDREKLNKELCTLRSTMVEAKLNMRTENQPYITVISWITTIPDVTYNDDEIRYVYHTLIGDEGYELQYTHWIPQSKEKLNDTEQRIVDLSRKYISNYNSDTVYEVFNNQRSYLEESDLKFLFSLYSGELSRHEFCRTPKIQDFAVRQMLKLLMAGRIQLAPEIFDTVPPVAQKLANLLSSYENDLPFYCIVTLKNGTTTINLC